MTMEDINRRINQSPVTSFAVAANDWNKHECNSDSDVCGCEFRFNCTQCGVSVVMFGEEMPLYIGNGGKCQRCFYGIRE